MSNAETTVRRDNPGEGGEGIPDGCDQSRMRVGLTRRDMTRNFKHDTKRKVNTMLNAIRQFVKQEEGASAAEYALLVGLITVAMAVTVIAFGTAITTAIANATAAIGS